MLSTQNQPSPFRLAERKYKFYKKPPAPPDYRDVFDLHDLDANTPENRARITQKQTIHCGNRSLPVYEIEGKDGLLIIPSILTPEEQTHWAYRSVAELASPPNHSNLPPVGCLPDNVWDTHMQQSSEQLWKLRWITLGYHYNWTTDIYENTPDRISEFPRDLQQLCKEHARLCGFSDYEPQAGIINYYQSNRSMMKAHRDESEFTFRQPILSYSIGNTAIFLLGDTTTNTPPDAIWMRSGDLMIMGGHSRIYYHGVARIFPDSTPPKLLELAAQKGHREGESALLQDYLTKTRINLNIRQVFPAGQRNVFLTDSERMAALEELKEEAQQS